MGAVDRVRELVAPLCAEHDAELFDIQHEGGVLRVTIDKDGGVDVGTLQALSRAVSRLLDETDPISSRYTLEVSSPGLERSLRTPEHYTWAVGKDIKLKTMPGVDGDRRVTGVLEAADDTGITVAGADGTRRLTYDQISKARTVFEWGPPPKPGKGPSDSAGAPRPDTRKASP